MIAELGQSCNTEETFNRLVSAYQPKILRMCAMYLRDDAAAEDAVQETFLKAYRALPRFRGECSEKTWLMRIAVNTCRDMTRSAWFRHTDRRVTPEDLTLAAESAASDEKEALAQAILLLPRKYKDALLLY
ncbi:MAG: sigma-70 family RNA polymerase sigma factor [Clostridia bacterium]|nr:sigma-70 family RNA polymerase sigma factor [Clostridia bacterium]